MIMSIRLQISIAVLVLVMLLTIMNMVRKEKIDLRYALSWIVLCILVLILDAFPGILLHQFISELSLPDPCPSENIALCSFQRLIRFDLFDILQQRLVPLARITYEAPVLLQCIAVHMVPSAVFLNKGRGV